MSTPKKPSLLRVTLVTMIAMGATVLGGLCLYELAGKTMKDFYGKLGELALQLAVVVIVGAVVKVFIDWGTSQRARYREKLEARKEFMRRVRAMHVTIQNARDLLNANRCAKTWGEQSRRLMKLRPEIEEISEDLKASHQLFDRHDEIIKGLEAINSYLREAGDEYVRSHGAVDSDYKINKSLADTIHERGMTWVQDFMARGAAYKMNYEANLTNSKGVMREEVYGA